jgi:sugar lactone lactonase YvrE
MFGIGFLVALAGCGGGGGGPGTPGPTPGGGPPGGGRPTAAFARLWVPHYFDGVIRGLNATTLARDVDGTADVTLTLPQDTRPNALCFDASFALWVSDNGGNRLLRFGRSQLAASGQPTPQIVIQSDGQSLAEPIGLQFDANRNLWVAVAGRVEMYAPDNLDESGPTTPNRVLMAEDFDLPAALRFDAAGNLWLTNASFARARNAVYVFTPDQLAAGGIQVPRLRIESDAFALIEGIEFDARGDLWVASNDGLSVSRFAAADLALPPAPATRRLTPVGSLEADADDSPTGRTVRKPGGIVFDRNGNLWIASQRGALGTSASAVVQFAAARLAGLAGGQRLAADVLVARVTSNPGFGGMALELL